MSCKDCCKTCPVTGRCGRKCPFRWLKELFGFGKRDDCGCCPRQPRECPSCPDCPSNCKDCRECPECPNSCKDCPSCPTNDCKECPCPSKPKETPKPRRTKEPFPVTMPSRSQSKKR